MARAKDQAGDDTPEKAETPEKPEKAGKSEKKPKADKPKGEKKERSKEDAGPKKKAGPPRLQTKYQQEILPALKERFGRNNPHSLPRLVKVVVNMGVGEANEDKKFLELATEALGLITGQKPVITKARHSIAGFKLREGQQIGCKVTLRRQRMYEFLDRLISMALPRVRDFRGLNPNGFDRRGNYNMGLTEQLVFPEINPDKFTKIQGMNITIVTTATTDDDARDLLARFGMPFRQSGASEAA